MSVKAQDGATMETEFGRLLRPRLRTRPLMAWWPPSFTRGRLSGRQWPSGIDTTTAIGDHKGKGSTMAS